MDPPNIRNVLGFFVRYISVFHYRYKPHNIHVDKASKKKKTWKHYVLKIFDFGVKMRCVQEMISLSIKHLPRMHYFERNWHVYWRIPVIEMSFLFMTFGSLGKVLLTVTLLWKTTFSSSLTNKNMIFLIQSIFCFYWIKTALRCNVQRFDALQWKVWQSAFWGVIVC